MIRKTQRSNGQQHDEKEMEADGAEEQEQDDEDGDDHDDDAEAKDAQDSGGSEEERKETETAVSRNRKPTAAVDIFASLSVPLVQPAASSSSFSSFSSSSSAFLLDALDDDGDTPAPSFPPLKKAKVQHTLAAAAQPVSTQQQRDGADEEDDVDDAVRLYAELQRSQRRKKQARTEASAPPPPQAGLIPSLHPELVDGKRRISRLIERNEGLKPSRPRDRKTPKTRNRARYDKAVVKRRSQVRQYAGSGGVYGGEATGIKRNVTKSVRLKS